MSQKLAENYKCDACDYECCKKSDMSKHELTRKHQFRINNPQNIAELAEKYTCVACDYECFKKSDMTKHELTRKHQLRTTSPEVAETKFTCQHCNKEYKARNSLWYHEKRCSSPKPVTNIDCNNVDYKELVNQLLIDNRELRNFIIEQSKASTDNVELKNFIIEQSKVTADTMSKVIEQNADIMTKAIENSKPTVINQTNNQNNNQKFNINVFLNEQCKDAMNFSDFIKGIEVSREDLENNAQLGFVNGISKIILDNLRQLSVNERPIHCTDLKRETMYIKDDDKWTKETGPAKLNTAILSISQKSARTLLDWKKVNPDYQDHDSEFSTRCIVIQRNSMAGYDRETYYPKVIRAIAKEVTI
jgi:hypothetical protein